MSPSEALSGVLVAAVCIVALVMVRDCFVSDDQKQVELKRIEHGCACPSHSPSGAR